jgi:hypothetical protein
MSDIKFSCPHCSQHIACDAQWSGLMIKCPDCQNDVIIPELPAAAKPAAAPMRITLAPAASPPAPPPALMPPLPAHGTRPMHSPPLPSRPTPVDGEGGRSTKRQVIFWAIAAIVVLPALYFGFGWAMDMQRKMNIARERERQNSGGGGQLGHIAELNSVLAATEPGKITSIGYDSGPSRATPIVQPETTKLNPPQWTLDLGAARIPSGKANGSISGGAFVVDRAYLEKSATGYVLTVRQGQGFQADREIIIYLMLKAGEKLDQKSWANSKSQTNGVSKVVKRWMAAGKQQTKAYPAGYNMKVEFGQTTGGALPARLFVALPDDEKTVVGGSVEASFLLAGGVQPRPARPINYDGEF